MHSRVGAMAFSITPLRVMALNIMDLNVALSIMTQSIISIIDRLIINDT
jgi:hypothetical protein